MQSQGRPLGKPLGNPLALRIGKGAPDGIPTRVGTPYGGGFYAGRMRGGDGRLYAIVCSPYEPPFDLTRVVQASNAGGNISRSDWDAVSNQASMIAADAPFEAAEMCAAYRGGGFDDWVLPAYAQLVMLYRAFKPGNGLNSVGAGNNPYAIPNPGPYTISDPAQTPLVEFQADNEQSFSTIQYHSSTLTDSSSNRIISFANGVESSQGALSTFRPIRAIRMVRIFK